jgi:hypothetical protein
VLLQCATRVIASSIIRECAFFDDLVLLFTIAAS